MNKKCPICDCYELGDGSEEADFEPCLCDEEDKLRAEIDEPMTLPVEEYF